MGDVLVPGDQVRLHRDYIHKVTPAGLQMVHVQRQSEFLRGRWRPARSRVVPGGGPGLAAARAKCRADSPADFVMQRYCIER